MDVRVETALRELARTEPDVERAVRRAWDDLTAGSGDPRDVSQWWLQLYLWDQLARSSAGTPQDAWRLASALGDLLGAVGLGRYAELARSDTTREILLASDDAERCSDLYAAALRASGIQPPDTELITWGPVMGPAEADAYERAANALELSMVSGDLRVGAPGSRAVRQRVTDAVLTAPQRDLNGLRPLLGIASERLHEWTVRSRTLAALLEPMTDSLTAGVPERLAGVPGELKRLRVLLDLVAEPVPLTAAGYLPKAVVVAFDERAGGSEYFPPGAGEKHNATVHWTRAAAQSAGLVRVHRKALTLTPRGRRARTGPDQLAAALAAGWFPTPRTAQVVAREVLAAVLAAGGATTLDDVAELTRAVLVEDGWSVAGGRVPLDAAHDVVLPVYRQAYWAQLVERERGMAFRARPALVPLLRAALRHHLMHHGLTQLR